MKDINIFPHNNIEMQYAIFLILLPFISALLKKNNNENLLHIKNIKDKESCIEFCKNQEIEDKYNKKNSTNIKNYMDEDEIETELRIKIITSMILGQ